jgi:hypothetical protein
LSKCLTRIALGFGDLFGWLNLARRLCHFFAFSPSATRRRIAWARLRVLSLDAAIQASIAASSVGCHRSPT